MRDAEAWYRELRAKTAPGLIAERARREPDAVAYRAKHLGLYRERTWLDYGALVARAAKGLQALGLAAGERIAIMGDACEEWILADLGAQALGAISYGIYPTASAAEVEYQMRDGGAAIFVAEDQEYLDKILPHADALPGLRWIVVVDDSALFAYDHPKVKTFEWLMAQGGDAGLETLEQLAGALDPKADAFIVYTSGTSGPPKGALVAHGAHLAAAANIVVHYPTLAEKTHRTVAYLPLCHMFGRDVAVTLPLLSRMVPHYGEGLEDLPQTLFEVAPTALFAVPRYLQKFASQVLVGIASTTPLKRIAYEFAMRAGRRHVKALWEGRREGELWERRAAGALANTLARRLVFRPLLEKLGLDRLELLVSGGAPLPDETMAIWQAWGVNTMQLYGQTETAGGIITGQRGWMPRPGNVGDAPPGIELRLADTDDGRGEILVRSPDLFEGYWGQSDATAGVKDAEGWLHTGDAGALDGANLRLVDRVRDFIVTSGGKTIAPAYVENLVRASHYVAEVMVVGHGRKYLTALVEIDFDAVAEWARGRDIAYAGFTSLATHEGVRGLIAGELARANALLARVEQVKDFRILPKALDPEEEGEPVTPTRKVKRALMVQRFRALVEEMYDDREERLLADGAGDLLRS